MTPTEKVQESFNADNIRIEKGFVQVYWHKDSIGEWLPAAGGTMRGSVVRPRVERLVKRVLNNRDMLPMEFSENTVLMGELTPDGKFITHVMYRKEI
jgi:hypothetical protein